MTARSVVTQIHVRMLQFLTGLLLLAAVAVAETPPTGTRQHAPKAEKCESVVPASHVIADEAPHAVADEFHPEVGIGPPTSILRTALKPEAGITPNYSNSLFGGFSGNSGINLPWASPATNPVPAATPSQTERTPRKRSPDGSSIPEWLASCRPRRSTRSPASSPRPRR